MEGFNLGKEKLNRRQVLRGGNIKYDQGLMAQEVQIPGVVVIAGVQCYGVASHCFKSITNGPGL
jgi:hypothetical protein